MWWKVGKCLTTSEILCPYTLALCCTQHKAPMESQGFLTVHYLLKKKCSVNLLAMYNSQLTRVYRMQCRKTYLKPFSQTFSWQTSVKTSLQSFVCLVMVIHFSLLLAQIHCRSKILNKMSHKGSSLTLLLIHEHSLNGIMTATAVS